MDDLIARSCFYYAKTATRFDCSRGYATATRAYRKLITRAAERNEILPGTKMRKEKMLTGFVSDTCPAYISLAVINRVLSRFPPRSCLLLVPGRELRDKFTHYARITCANVYTRIVPFIIARSTGDVIKRRRIHKFTMRPRSALFPSLPLSLSLFEIFSPDESR